MEASWYRIGTPAWWIAGTLFFLGFELVFKMKLGSVYMFACFCVLAQQWLALKLGHPVPDPDPLKRAFYAMYSALFMCGAVFVAFAVVNIILRTINNDWRWFQLP